LILADIAGMIVIAKKKELKIAMITFVAIELTDSQKNQESEWKESKISNDGLSSLSRGLAVDQPGTRE